MRRLCAGVCLVAALAVSACDDFKAPARGGGEASHAPASTFSHTISSDISGDYQPTNAASVDGFRIKGLFLGQEADFAAWEAGVRSQTFAPVMIEFEKGGETVRVLPTTYAVTDGRVRFEGKDARLGRVAFDGALDVEALATARRNLGEEAAVLTGTLRAGGTAFGGQTFRWYGGD